MSEVTEAPRADSIRWLAHARVDKFDGAAYDALKAELGRKPTGEEVKAALVAYDSVESIGNLLTRQGKKRIMDVTWDKKIGDKGPTFKIVNTGKLEVLYGKIVVYFYDKAGKQIDLPGGGEQPRAPLDAPAPQPEVAT